MSAKKSPVWKHFKITDDNPKKVQCQICQVKLAYHHSTTNLANRLKSVHPMQSVPAAATTQRQRSLDQMAKTPLPGKRKRDITDGLVTFIAMDMRPVNTVHGAGFRCLMDKLEPGYTIPNRQTITEEIDKKYTEVRGILCGIIKNSPAVSFTTDNVLI
ncbi:hypothetical protein AAFF_G00242340 [Aldrovandia affinis]|uniref:BED-type domain-containing protein n=1 Tax=Aldrovandia affinis TaxID=143900 RepID=A0AAD7WU76_9TELE|nr:hypothetical protein AAFF_G00242340 [Aldrovandia affinis]